MTPSQCEQKDLRCPRFIQFFVLKISKNLALAGADLEEEAEEEEDEEDEEETGTFLTAARFFFAGVFFIAAAGDDSFDDDEEDEEEDEEEPEASGVGFAAVRLFFAAGLLLAAGLFFDTLALPLLSETSSPPTPCSSFALNPATLTPSLSSLSISFPSSPTSPTSTSSPLSPPPHSPPPSALAAPPFSFPASTRRRHATNGARGFPPSLSFSVAPMSLQNTSQLSYPNAPIPRILCGDLRSGWHANSSASRKRVVRATSDCRRSSKRPSGLISAFTLAHCVSAAKELGVG